MPNGVDLVALLPNGFGPFPEAGVGAVDAEVIGNPRDAVAVADGSLPGTPPKPAKRDETPAEFTVTGGAMEVVISFLIEGSPSRAPKDVTRDGGEDDANSPATEGGPTGEPAAGVDERMSEDAGLLVAYAMN